MERLLFKLAIVTFLLVSVASCGLDSGNTGLSPIAHDLKGHGADQIIPENPGAEVLVVILQSAVIYISYSYMLRGVQQ